MDRISDYSSYAIALAALIPLLLFLFFLRPDPEAPVPYTVPPPPECHPDWQGEILDSPSLKVCFSPLSDRASS